MFGLITRNKAAEIEVVWVKENEILAVQNNKNKPVTFITVYGELFLPETFEEVQSVITSSSSTIIKVDKELLLNVNKITEKNEENRSVKLEGVEDSFYVSMRSWNEIIK